MRSLAFSPIMMVGAFVFEPIEARHHGGVTDAQPFNTAHAQLRINDRHIIHSHLAGSDRMIGGSPILAGIGFELGLRTHLAAGEVFLFDIFAHGWLAHHFAA